MSNRRFYHAASLVAAALTGRISGSSVDADLAQSFAQTGEQPPRPPTPRELRRRRMAAVVAEPPKVYADRHGLRPSTARADARRRRQIERGQLKPST